MKPSFHTKNLVWLKFTINYSLFKFKLHPSTGNKLRTLKIRRHLLVRTSHLSPRLSGWNVQGTLPIPMAIACIAFGCRSENYNWRHCSAISLTVVMLCVCFKRVCVCNTELLCKQVPLAFLCQTSAISFPFIAIPWFIRIWNIKQIYIVLT